MSDYSIYIQSNAGGRHDNQDYYASKETGQGLLVVVCDGMGGTAGGRVAAEMACSIMTDNFSRLTTEPVNGIVQSVRAANQAIFSKGKSDQSLQNMGTTVAALLIQKEEATFFHAGDSRIYLVRNGNIEKRTADHSKVGEMVRRGILSNEQARLSAESNIISKAVGIEPDIDVEVTTGIKYQKGDRFVVCTDGIWGTLPEEKLVSAWSEMQPAATITNALIEQINTAQYAAGGGHDNMTMALVQVNRGGFKKFSITTDRLLNFVLGLALVISLIFNFTGKGTGGSKPVHTKDSTTVDTSKQKIFPDTSVKKTALDTALQRVQAEQERLKKVKEIVRKLAEKMKEDSTGKVKPLVIELSKEIEKIK
jgi:serine/threonine protein phosphatase PrpC